MLSQEAKNLIKEIVKSGYEYELRTYIDEVTDAISIPWKLDDIQLVAEGMDIELTEEQKYQVLTNLYDNFDAEVGINWDVLVYAIRDVVS